MYQYVIFSCTVLLFVSSTKQSPFHRYNPRIVHSKLLRLAQLSRWTVYSSLVKSF